MTTQPSAATLTGHLVTVTSPDGTLYTIHVEVTTDVPEGVKVTGAVKSPRSARGQVVTAVIPAQVSR